MIPPAYGFKTVEKNLNTLLTDWGETDFHVDDVLTRHVSYFLKYYAVQDAATSNKVIRRSEKYLNYIKYVFQTQGIHEDIAFALPFVESGFNSHIKSNAGAVGMFQFVAPTARDYGLKVTGKKDDRTDYKKAAVACARYLRNNRRVFSSAVLSLGSYHHGTKIVTDALLTYGDDPGRRFGPIFKNRHLGPYSREYIPQCLAAALMYRYLKKNALTALPVPKLVSKRLRKKVAVKSLLKQHPKLYQVNPDLKHAKSTYSYASTNGYVFVSNITYLPASEIISRKLPAWAQNPALAPSGETKVKGLPKTIHYVFQRHNELPMIASIFGTGVKALKFNNRYLVKRAIRSGDIIEIKGMAPTTQVIDGKGTACGQPLELTTINGDTLMTFSERATQTIRSACTQSSWEMGNDLSPELIYYWNTDLLGYIKPDTPLKGNLALKIYSDYLWHKKPDNNETYTTSLQ